MKTRLCIQLTVEGQEQNIEYTTLHECLYDEGLKTLFDLGIISTCRITLGNTFIGKIPEQFLTWSRFVDKLVTNSSKILKEEQKHTLVP